jgi:hypothetical protein
MHPERDAARVCEHCGARSCAECAVDGACSEACAGALRRGHGLWGIRPRPIGIVALLILLAGWIWLLVEGVVLLLA